MTEDETFLRRWARRKQGVADEDAAERPPARRMTWRLPAEPAPQTETSLAAEAETAAMPPVASSGRQPADPAAEEAAAEGEAAGDAEVEAALPPLESLGYDSDYRGFMAEGVSEALRRQALRRLWRSNPVLANVDGLNDYDGDFTDAAMVKSGLKTAFDVLRGYAREEAPEDEIAADEESREDEGAPADYESRADAAATESAEAVPDQDGADPDRDGAGTGPVAAPASEEPEKS